MHDKNDPVIIPSSCSDRAELMLYLIALPYPLLEETQCPTADRQWDKRGEVSRISGVGGGEGGAQKNSPLG